MYFAPLSSRLNATARKSLNALIKGRKKSITRAVVNGFVQGSDTTANDRALSLARARSVARYLKARGIAGKVIVRAKGVSKDSSATGRKAVARITFQS